MGTDAAPRVRPAMPARLAEPAALSPASEFQPPEIPDTIPDLIEDEETIAAAPDASAFARRVVVPKPGHGPLYANLFFRRTLIPILLTCGLLLLTIGLWSMIDHNAPLAAAGLGTELLLIALGIVLLGVGVLNVLQVKAVLEATAKSLPESE